MTKKRIEVNDLSLGQFSDNKNIRFKNSVLRSNLCAYSDAYIVVKGAITVKGTDDAIKRNKKLTFENYALFRSCISKVNNTFIGNAEDYDIVIPMCKLLEYSNNHSKMFGSLWNYYRDEINDSANENNDANNYRTNNNKTTTSKFFEYKTKIIGRLDLFNNYLLFLFYLFILKLKNLNTVLCNYIQNNPIFIGIIFYFYHKALMHGFKCFINV